MADKYSFHVKGVTLHLPDGDLILNAGQNMTIFPSGDLITFAAVIPKGVTSINGVSGDVTLDAGPGITIDVTGSKITISTGDAYVTEGGFSSYVTEDGASTYIPEA